MTSSPSQVLSNDQSNDVTRDLAFSKNMPSQFASIQSFEGVQDDSVVGDFKIYFRYRDCSHELKNCSGKSWKYDVLPQWNPSHCYFASPAECQNFEFPNSGTVRVTRLEGKLHLLLDTAIVQLNSLLSAKLTIECRTFLSGQVGRDPAYSKGVPTTGPCSSRLNTSNHIWDGEGAEALWLSDRNVGGHYDSMNYFDALSMPDQLALPSQLSYVGSDGTLRLFMVDSSDDAQHVMELVAYGKIALSN